MCVCVFVCLFANLSPAPELHVQSSYMLPVSMAWSVSAGRHCDMLRTSGFTLDVVFARNRSVEGASLDRGEVWCLRLPCSPPICWQYVVLYPLVFVDLSYWYRMSWCGLWYGALCVAWRRSGYSVGLATQKRSRIRISAVPLSGNNLEQVVHTHVLLSPSSIIWYRSRGGDALRLGR